MRHALLLIFSLALLSGCSKESQDYFIPCYKTATYYVSTLDFEQAEKNAWAIIAPRAGHYREWNFFRGARNDNALLPRHFPSQDVRTYPLSARANFFYATYPLADRELAVFISMVGPPRGYKNTCIGWRGKVVGEDHFLTDTCAHSKLMAATASFSAADVDFDTASLYLVRNGEKTAGTLIMCKEAMFVDIQKRDHNTYHLASAATINAMQFHEEKYSWRHRAAFYNYPTFHYIFELTCTDLEGAVLVIDGLYHKGERLAPLKVRLNYADLSKVPQYIGPASAPEGG
ncbi:MAG: hypothetical protein LBC79_02140 [Deltaproteobacteria bacterium]|jgi:hypothetical protein|nr:hypothetical protein [Deltaproteobacteria bacterium]